MRTRMLSAVWLGLACLALNSAAGDGPWLSVRCPDVVNSNSIRITFVFNGSPPEWTGVFVEPSRDRASAPEKHRNETQAGAKKTAGAAPDFNLRARWTSFETNLTLDLGPGDGKRTIQIGFKYAGESRCDSWEAYDVRVRSTQPVIHITSPKETLIAQPMIQIVGYCPVDLESIRYDVMDQTGRKTTSDAQALVNNRYYDPVLAELTTNYFTAYDVALTVGTNIIAFRATDEAGNMTQTNFVFVFSTAQVTDGPKLAPEWPLDQSMISPEGHARPGEPGARFTLRGQSDDPTASIMALLVNSAGESWRQGALLERDGRYWVDEAPLFDGQTYITLIARNAAGFSTLTNLSVRKSRYQLSMNPVVPPSLLWRSKLNLTGTATCPPDYTIWVNGVQATYSNGIWKADNVPLTQGTVASFDLKALPPGTNEESEELAAPTGLPIVWGAATNGIQWGAYLCPGDDKHRNRQQCDFYLLDRSGTNARSTWIRPKADALYAVALEDSSGKALTRSFSGREFGKPLTPGLNVHHLDPEAIANIDGVIPVTANSPFHMATVDLMNLFSELPPGEYRLRTSGRLYEVEPGGNLRPIELPVVSLTLSVETQPSELTFHLRRLLSQGALAVGESVDGIQVGVAHDFSPRTRENGGEIEIYLMNTSTNDFHNLILPTPAQAFTVGLADRSGKSPPRTTLGSRQGEPASVNDHRLELKPVLLKARDATLCARFNLASFFELSPTGPYRLTYQQRLFRIATNGTPQLLRLPPVTAQIRERPPAPALP